MTKFSDREACSPGFPERYLDACRGASPLAKWAQTGVDYAASLPAKKKQEEQK